MVKARFPGKPAKHFNRRRVSGVNSDGNEGITAAEDVYRRLSLFYSLFHTDDEDNNFHGFSPHEIDLKSSNQNTTPSGSKQIKRKKRVQCSPRKLNISSLNNRGDSKEQITDEKDVPNSLTELKKDFGLDSEKSKTESFSDSSKHVNSKDNIPSNTTLSGKFVLPSRSVHSSRVIKPNKRFLQNDTTPVPYKRSRLGVSSDIRDPDLGTYSLNQKNSESHMKTDISAFDQRKSSVGPGKSPVKFVLRKPRLKIKTQTLPVVGGPFSSPGGNSLNLQGLRNPRPSLTKVFCGVCGALRTCKLFRQAQKFGIFCCDMCRKFILRMIRSERDKSLLPLNCSSGNGNCPIRQNSLIAQGFPNDSSEKDFDEQERCEACWLNWCLKSFDMPQKLVKRLSNFLPVNVIQKPILSFSKVPGTDWRDIHKSTLTEQSKTNIKLGATNIEPRLGRRNKGIRENINIRRASNMSLRLSSHRGRGLRDYEDTKKGRGRQKLPVTGPRVKHVCRSASLVLGQPVATFDPIVGSKGGAAVNNIEEKIQNEAHEETINILDSELQINSDNEKVKHTQSQESDVSPIEQADVDFPPVARMLQDLGRANCELLDGIENHEFERQNARVSIDFWESYDPEEVSQMGFPLIGFSPLKLRALCFLCGSAGLEKMVHCASCCEPYHTFCVSNVSINQSGDWWQLDWLCPKCTKCEACLKTGGTQLSCTKCKKSYHSNCISSMRINIYDNNWVCPSCLFCKSCNGSSVHVFVGNMPLCKSCFKLRKRGNFCPLCQCCYDDNDYNTKMMECAKCQCWIHANCEGISNEKYQVLSYLPSSIEFICKLCCDDPPAAWSLAVNAELKAGYLNVIKILSKNRNACAMFKASPKKQRLCVCSDKHRNPIHLPNLISGVETEDGFNIDSPMGSSPDRDYKSSDLGLLTPKLTKDDEESLKTVKTDFLNLVAEKDKTKDLLDKPVSKKSEELLSANKNSQLLSIVYNKLVSSEEMSTADNLIDKDNIPLKDKSNQSNPDRVCTCQISESSQYQPLSLLSVKNKANNDEYRSVFEFHSDMECVMKEIGNCDLITTYSQSLKQIFPWFNIDESTVLDTSLTERESLGNNKVLSPRPSEKQSLKKNEEFTALKGLLNLEQDCYYMGLSFQETRMCLFCKMVGEGNPKREGRLLYCGQNEWVHANCALWSSEVFEEIDGSLQNVHSAVSRARLIRCVHCEKKGASLGCCAKSCPSAYHFSCALLADCILLETKEIYCKAHSNLRNGKEIHYDDDFLIKRSVYVELDRKKKKDVLRNQVRIYIGSLEVCQIGEILPEFSDYSDVIIPCDFKCSRLYWSCKEPWKIVRYSIQTKVTNMLNEYSYENDTNYTVDHSLEFTPPPSPVEFNKNNSNASPDFCEKEIKAVVNQIIDTICSKEEDNTINDQQNTDILPPELTDAIFDDLPKDFLDRITVHDIFTKMSFDDMLLSESQSIREASDCSTHLDPLCNKLKVQNDNTKEKNNKPTNLYKVVRAVKQNAMDKMKDCEMLLDSEKVNKWKRSSIIQVDGAMDFSESDQSNDSCDLDLNNKVLTDNCEINEDKPVKCSRCHRTYRTNLSYERHLTTCNADYLSGSESECSEEEKTQGGETEDSTSIDLNITHLNHSSSQINSDSQVHLFNVPVEVNTIAANSQNIQTVVQNSFENSMICVNNSNFNGVRESSESILNINYSSINNDIVQNTGYRNDQTLVTSVDTVVSEPVVNLQQPTIFLQQMPSDNVLPSAFVSTPFQEQQSNIQYITAINTQEKTQYLSTNSIGSTTYHIQPSLPQSVVQNVPTVVGTIVQSNGVEQIVLNNPGTGLDVYGHQQNNMYISNTPMIVGMETVVSNTVMSSSRFISGAAPGMLASSYSATTTQVFQAAKPVIDIPQSYVVVNSPIVENNGTCVQNIIQNGSLSNPSWNGYKISYQDALKLNKNVTYQTVSQQIVAQKQDINGVKIVNPSDHTILVTPSSVKVGRAGLPSVREKINVQNVPCVNNCKNGNSKQPNPVKVVELPFSSANHREKPQQAVAPVVIKKVIEPTQVKETFPNQSICKRDVNNKVESPCQVPFTNLQETNPSTPGTTKLMEAPPNKEMNHVPENKSTIIQDISTPSIIVPSKLKEPKEYEPMKLNGSEILKKRKIVHEEPKISFEISSDDGFSFNTTSLNDAWNTVFETVQKARKAKNLPPLTQNPFSSPDSMLKKLMGLGNNSMKYLLEQLPGISSCSKYKPVYHKKIPSALEKELSKGKTLNPSGCARTEPFRYTHKTYDMFSWLASRHRRPPKLHSDTDGLNGNSRRATSMNLPMAMRFRHLKETSKASVGVFRSDIHGRGLFCLRDIDAGEMVIEYAGEVIRSALTDKRERYYTEKGIGCYMFRIDDKFVVDATMKGNAARFINHSCEPNCYSRVIDILGKKHILIFAHRKILQGEELTYDYKFPLEEDKINCHCLSRKCRKYLN